MSEVLDEERRELFLQTLQALREEQKRNGEREAQIQRERDEEMARERMEAEKKRAEAAKEEEERLQKQKQTNGKTHKRTSSEVDYGIETSNPNNPSKIQATKVSTKSAKSTQSGRAQFPPTPHSPRAAKRQAGSSGIYNRATHIVAALQHLVGVLGQSVARNPMVLVRTVLFLMGLILAFSRRDVRDRVRRITGASWDKMRGTVGMGVKVSYI